MKKSKEIAFGGMMAALAVVIMCFGGMIPFMTYVSPVIAMIIGAVVLKIISKAGFFTWYFAVAILAVLLSPDKEAASVFIAFGCYPAVRMIFEKSPFRWLLKFIYFNIVILILYWLLINIMGMQQLASEFADLGKIMTILMLIIGNVIFVMIDLSLRRLDGMKKFKVTKE